MAVISKIFYTAFFVFFSSIIYGQDPSVLAVQRYLNIHHKSLGVAKKDVLTWEVTDNYTSKNDITHLHIMQTINGIKVKNGTANFALNAEDSVLFVANRLIQFDGSGKNINSVPSLSAKQAIEKSAALSNMVGTAGSELEVDKTNLYKFKKGSLSKEDIDVELAYWHTGEAIRLVWITTLYELNAQHWWQIFIDANSGEELNRVDWVVSCELHHHPINGSTTIPQMKTSAPEFPAPPPPSTDQYNVFSLPIESPNHGAVNLATGPSSAVASPFGWHDVNGIAGEEYTITRGNNVYAYEDVSDLNIPGYSPDGGPALSFNFPVNINQVATNYQDAAITNLFYMNNRIHDIFYQYGFDEASGNFQENNYGNGGAAADYVLAEAQDGGGFNNANFATPPDGSNPRMQMYLWANTGLSSLLTVNSPASISGAYLATEAGFGPGVPSTPLTADLVLIDDGVSPVDDGCEAAINGAAVAGKIAVIYRGGCTFALKVENAQNAGAVGVIIINNVAGTPITMGGASNIVTIPSIMISQADGATLIGEMATGLVNATLASSGGNFDKDGSFDNGIIIHEYGHGISNRLTGGPSNSGCLSNEEQMGEGWSDILACLLTMDTSVANPVYRPIGTFATSEPTTGGGIRNAPYDTSFVVNDYTYGDVADVANVSQPHGIGFVWATMLWDLNWAFINQYGFDANIESGTGGNNMVLELIIEGLKLQPCSPGFVDGRDAILQADQLLNNGVNQCLIWSVFAKRGLGFSASQGSSNSRTDQVEAFDVPPICAIATSPPNAAFDANTYQTCSGFIQFEDLSTNTPQNWMWDFGDGATDTIQNPSHVYGSPGLYTVKLIVSNSIGVDSLIEIDFITVTTPDNPIVVNGQGCSTDSILLSATGTYDIHWTDLSGNLLAVGNDYHTVPSTTSSSYYAVNVQDFTNAYVGPLDNSIGAGGNHNTAFIGAINFEAETELTIYSAWVESGSAGIRTVTLWDAYNSGGNAIQVVDVDIPFVGAGRVELGFHIPGPGQYSIGLSNADLYRNNSGANYPYVLPGLMTIVSSSATTTPADFYYYFYDLEVSETSCSSDSVLVTATVANTDFDWNNIGLTANFFDLTTGGSSWLWNFGDGATSTVQNPIHTYSGYGNYNVSLQVDGGCTVSYEILIDNNLGLSNSTGNNFEILLFPNPANDELNISFNKVLTTQAIIEIFSIDGKLVQTACIGVGRNSTTISVANLASQVYFLKLNYNDGIQVKKLVVD